MTKPGSDYLWRAEGRPSPEDAGIVELERELATLGWQPQPLALDTGASAPAAATVDSPLAAPLDLASARRERPWQLQLRHPGVVAGALAAAAVFAAMVLGPAVETPSTGDPINPAASPQLKDPFGSRPAGFEAPTQLSPDLQDPFASPLDDSSPNDSSRDEPPDPRRVSPDLVDPFGGVTAPPPTPIKTKPGPKSAAKTTKKGRVSPDLLDPFAPRPEPLDDAVEDVLLDDPPAKPKPTLTDPFTGEPKPYNPKSPDLQDPFAR